MSHAIVVDDLRFAWPDGAVLFDGIGFAVGPGRSALIGANGAGKSTLLRLMAGELVPSRGSVQVAGSLGWLRQDLTLAADLEVEEVLGVARARRALRAIEAGEVAAEHFAAVGDDWDVEERAQATLDRLGLGHLGLDRRVGEVSGGEAVLLGAGRAAAAATRRAAAGRADQQPGPAQHPPAVAGAGGLPGRAAGCQPRPAVPGDGGDHPLAAPGRPADRDRPAVTWVGTLAGMRG